MRTKAPIKSPEPTAVGAVSSAVAVHAGSRRWLYWSLGGFRVMAERTQIARCLVRFIVVISVAVLLYVVAYGPAWSLAVRFPKTAPILGTIYEPLPRSFQGDLLQLWCHIDKRVLATLEHYD